MRAALAKIEPSETGPGAALTLERFLPYRLNVLASRVSNALAAIYAERFGLTIPGWRVLAALGQFEVATARDIAAHAVMHKSTVSRAVAALTERGLVARAATGAAKTDLREAPLALTDEGLAVYATIVPEALAFEATVQDALSPAERATFFALLERLDRRARTLARADTPAPTP